MEHIHMTSWQPYWCSKTKKRRPYWFHQAIPPGIKIYFYSKIIFCLGKPIWLLVTRVNTLYIKCRLVECLRRVQKMLFFLAFWVCMNVLTKTLQRGRHLAIDCSRLIQIKIYLQPTKPVDNVLMFCSGPTLYYVITSLLLPVL